MPDLLPRLLPFLALLGLLAGSSGWLDRSSGPEGGLTFAVAANGMIIDPDGKPAPGGAPVTIEEPTEPGH
jgi:hypothetical protein